MEASAIQAVPSESNSYMDFFQDLKQQIDIGSFKSLSVNDGNFQESKKIEAVSFDGDTVFLCLDNPDRLNPQYAIHCDKLSESLFQDIVDSIN